MGQLISEQTSNKSDTKSNTSLPVSAGISLKTEHYQQIVEEQPAIGWFEIHPENYMGAGGAPHYFLDKICQRYPLSMHSVGMSLGSADGINTIHLNQLKKLIERYAPLQVSDHVSWSRWDGAYLNDLLPLPYTHEALSVLCRNISQVQDTLKRTILIENPSVYLEFDTADYEEGDFLKELCDRTGCGILLDVNNIFVSAQNQDKDPQKHLEKYSFDAVQEIHLAGHAKTLLENGKEVLIDNHGSKICDNVWALYETALKKLPAPIATLVEWDTDIPELETLLSEAQKAQTLIEKYKNN